MDPAKYAEIFLEESRENLTQVNQQLLDWERAPDAAEPVAAIFRAVHNIKGMAATMGYSTVATLAHRMENLLDLLRRGEGSADEHTIQLLFRAADGLEKGIEVAVSTGDAGYEVSDLVRDLDDTSAGLETAKPRAALDRPSVPAMTVPVLGGRGVRVVIRPDAPLRGARALIVLAKMGEAGSVFGVQPPPAVIEGDDFDGRFEFHIESAIEDHDLDELIRTSGDIEEVTIQAAAEESDEDDASSEKARHIRVDLRRLDTLMNQIGEMVTVRGQLVDLSARRADPELEDLAVRISHLTHDLQSEIIQARMTPGWQVFDRFPRLVRDTARKLGKRVNLRVEGKEIELDRALLDELGDPLMHLLRNAVDHSIEMPEDRAAVGKPSEGLIVLSAARERSTIVIRIEDDGNGVDRAAVLKRAEERGLVPTETSTLSDDGLLSVLAHPGFSTAEAVSDVSGRGVGIDVVMNRLRLMGGSLELKTVEGKGSTFTLRLPPTLAIVPALLADVQDELYALPLTHVEETLDLAQVSVTEVEGAESIVIRGQVVPLVRLRSLVELDGEAPANQPVIVVGIGDRRSGLVVDRVSSQREIVVKTFKAPVGTVPIFSGATILGDGRAVFILDAARLV
jgi:two-component system chemotaxis sensor kinase CheA